MFHSAHRYLMSFLTSVEGLHELDPVFRKVTLENGAMKAVVRDLQVHRDPVGKHRMRRRLTT